MAKYNPFFEKAGMRRVAESTPDKRVQKSLVKLEEIGLNPESGKLRITSSNTNFHTSTEH